MFCQKCGSAAAPETEFCMSCKAPLPAAGTAAIAVVQTEQRPRTSRFLIVAFSLMGLVLLMGVCNAIFDMATSSSTQKLTDPSRHLASSGYLASIELGADQAAIVMERCSVPSHDIYIGNEARYMEYLDEGVAISFDIPSNQPAPRHWVIEKFEDLRMELKPYGHPSFLAKKLRIDCRAWQNKREWRTVCSTIAVSGEL